MLLEFSGEITPERMKGWNQSKNNTQLWMSLVIEARSDAVKQGGSNQALGVFLPSLSQVEDQERNDND